MSVLKRLLALSGLTGLLGALAFAAPADAELKAQCVIDGEVKAHTTKPAFKKYVQMVGGSGTFAFASIATACVDLGTAKVPGTVHIGSVSTTGSFKAGIGGFDTVCGSGKVVGRVSEQTLHPKFNAILGRKFAIEFGVAAAVGPMNGVFYWHLPGPPGKAPSLPKFGVEESGKVPSGPKPYRYAGEFQLGNARSSFKFDDPVKRADHPDKCAKAFAVNGTVLVHES